MFTLFRWLCLITASLVQSPIFSIVKDLALIESDEELEAILRDSQSAGIAANLATLK